MCSQVRFPSGVKATAPDLDCCVSTWFSPQLSLRLPTTLKQAWFALNDVLHFPIDQCSVHSHHCVDEPVLTESHWKDLHVKNVMNKNDRSSHVVQCVSILRWCHSGLRGGHYGPQPSVDQLNQYWVCSGWLVSLVNSSDCNLLQRELVETVTNVKTPQRQTCWHAAVTFDLRDTSINLHVWFGVWELDCM